MSKKRKKWLVWPSCEPVTNAKEIDAFSATDAAEKWAELDDKDSADYDIAKGQNVEVCVKAKDGIPDRRFFFEIEGEFHAAYTAYELTDEADESVSSS